MPVQTITGTTRLSKETKLAADSIVFKSDAVVVTNGFKLTITASELTFEGSPKVVSFEPRANRPAGDAGRSGGPVIIQATKVDGTVLEIMNIGESGMKGAAGAAGSPGSKGPQGTQRDWNPWNGCIGGSNGGQGSPGGDGGQGGPGGNGGNGGSIILDIKSGFWNGHTPRLNMNVVGAAGGEGGAAGSAGPGGPGGDGAPGTTYCGGTQPGPTGISGRAGVSGAMGAPGNAGTIIDLDGHATPQPQ